MSRNLIYKVPFSFTKLSVKEFLKEAEGIFRMKEKNVADVVLYARETRNMDLLGSLLLYKFMEYTHKNQLFARPTFDVNESVIKSLMDSDFKRLVEAYIAGKSIDESMVNLKYKEKQGLFIAPINLSACTKETMLEDLTGKINGYYRDKLVSFVVLQILGEVCSNFITHADDQYDSILVAQGDKNKLEIACADTGMGVVSSLKNILSKEECHAKYEVLEKALEKGVSSKLSEGSFHMGFGLWMIDSIVTAQKGELRLFSEGAYSYNLQGKHRKGEFPYWKGTIIYVYLPLSKIERTRKIIEELNLEYDIPLNIL